MINKVELVEQYFEIFQSLKSILTATKNNVFISMWNPPLNLSKFDISSHQVYWTPNYFGSISPNVKDKMLIRKFIIRLFIKIISTSERLNFTPLFLK